MLAAEPCLDPTQIPAPPVAVAVTLGFTVVCRAALCPPVPSRAAAVCLTASSSAAGDPLSSSPACRSLLCRLLPCSRPLAALPRGPPARASSGSLRTWSRGRCPQQGPQLRSRLLSSRRACPGTLQLCTPRLAARTRRLPTVRDCRCRQVTGLTTVPSCTCCCHGDNTGCSVTGHLAYALEVAANLKCFRSCGSVHEVVLCTYRVYDYSAHVGLLTWRTNLLVSWVPCSTMSLAASLHEAMSCRHGSSQLLLRNCFAHADDLAAGIGGTPSMPRIGQAATVPPPLAEELSGVVLPGETLAEHRAGTNCHTGRAQGVHTHCLGRVYGQPLVQQSDITHNRQAPAQTHMPPVQRRHQRTCMRLPAQRLSPCRAACPKLFCARCLHLPLAGFSAPPKVSTLPFCCPCNLPGQAGSTQTCMYPPCPWHATLTAI